MVFSAVVVGGLRSELLHYSLPQARTTQFSTPPTTKAAQDLLTLNLSPSLDLGHRTPPPMPSLAGVTSSLRAAVTGSRPAPGQPQPLPLSQATKSLVTVTLSSVKQAAPEAIPIALVNAITLLSAWLCLLVGRVFLRHHKTRWAGLAILGLLPLLADISAGGRLGWYLGSWEPITVGHLHPWLTETILLMPHGLLELSAYILAWAYLRVSVHLAVPFSWSYAYFGALFLLLLLAGYIETLQVVWL